MAKMELVAPTFFGIEALTAREIKRLGYADVMVEDGRVTFISDIAGICKANLWLRTTERVLIKVGEFPATTFDELFENTKALPWDQWIPQKGAFPVKDHSLKSRLFSVPDCQAIVKKTVVEKLKKEYKKNGLLYPHFPRGLRKALRQESRQKPQALPRYDQVLLLSVFWAKAGEPPATGYRIKVP